MSAEIERRWRLTSACLATRMHCTCLHTDLHGHARVIVAPYNHACARTCARLLAWHCTVCLRVTAGQSMPSLCAHARNGYHGACSLCARLASEPITCVGAISFSGACSVYRLPFAVYNVRKSLRAKPICVKTLLREEALRQSCSLLRSSVLSGFSSHERSELEVAYGLLFWAS